MKKFAKMSLVAAVAVAGFTSANAASLTEAIKGVDVTGTLVYRYNDYNDDTTNPAGIDGTNNYYKLAVDVAVPVNDTISAGMTFEANSAFAGSNTSNGTWADPSITLGGANFTFTGLADTTVIAGLQAVPTPWTVAADSDGATHNGTGLVAVNTSLPVTLVGAYFNQTSFGSTTVSSLTNHELSGAGAVTVGKNSASIYVLGAAGTFGGVSLSAFYADQIDVLESYTVSADYKMDLDGVALAMGLRHTELELDALTTTDKLTKGYISAKAGIFDAKVAYGQTGNDGGLVAFDNSAATAMEGWNTELNGQFDASYLQLHAGVQALDTVNIALNWFDRDGKTTVDDEEEIYTQITWKPSKNFYTYVRLGQFEKAGSDKSDAGRLQMQYSF